MDLWNVHIDPKNAQRLHTLAPGFGHSLLAPLLTYIFRTLQVSAAVWEHADLWFPIHNDTNLSRFEQGHARDVARAGYNDKWFAEVRRTRRLQKGEQGGYSDLFVPIVARDSVVAVLVTGPFATARAGAVDVEERWRALTGRAAHATDGEFSAYLAATLDLLVLERAELAAFERVLEALALLMSGAGDAQAIANRIEAERLVLESVRAVDRIWSVARTMVDESLAQVWHSAATAFSLDALGLGRVPDAALVGLVLGAEGADFVDHAVRVDRFQREAVHLAQKTGGMIAGRVGNQGVAFLVVGKGSSTRRKRELAELADRAARLGRRLGLSLHFGAAPGSENAALSASYHAALGSAEAALLQGARVLHAEGAPRGPAASLRSLRQELARTAEERPALLTARFDRYLELAALHGGYRTDLTRVYLEVAFEELAAGLATSGALDAKSFVALSGALDRASLDARSLGELYSVYRRAVADLVAALQEPVAAHHDRTLRGATEFVRAHFTEPIDFKKVARAAGFAPNYFSRLFRQREGMTFEHYVRGLRLERATQLLTSTELDVARVARLSGFNSTEYFARTFKKLVGTTPIEFRRTRRPERAEPHRAPKRLRRG